MTTPKHLKIQVLVAFMLMLFGGIFAANNPDPNYGISASDALPAIVGFFWLVGALFTIWWRVK